MANEYYHWYKAHGLTSKVETVTNDYMRSAKRQVYAQSVAGTRRGKDVQSALSVRSEQTEPQKSTAEKAGKNRAIC